MKKVKDLYCDTVEYKPRLYDFGVGFPEIWDLALNLTEEEQDNQEYFPMMNYIYELPQDFERDMQNLFGDDWQTKIKKALSNMTLVTIEDDYFLALTGGGMDMSWEICETYINLGYLPPVHFCGLPAMAGINYKRSKIRRIIQACKRSCRVSIGWSKNKLEDLKRLHNYSTNMET